MQFGLPYGLYHSGRPLSREQARDVLAAAWQGGIDLLDTGAAYGDAEKSIGELRPAGAQILEGATLKAVLDRFPVQIVQLPVNLLDQRFVHDGTLALLARSNIEVHARSVFLQGVLLADAAQLPPRFAGVRGRIERLDAQCAARGVSRAAAALRFVASCPGVSRIVIGVNSAAQLKENLSAFSVATAGSWDLDAAAYALDDAEIIDPRKWAA